jgi:hypothetical protein
MSSGHIPAEEAAEMFWQQDQACPKCGSTSLSTYELLPDPDGERRHGHICNACKHKFQTLQGAIV